MFQIKTELFPDAVGEAIGYCRNRLDLKKQDEMYYYDRLGRFMTDLLMAEAISAKPLTTVVEPARNEALEEAIQRHPAGRRITSFTATVGPDHDPVNHPKHYTFYTGLEIIDLTEQMNFNRGNAVKYISRAGLKSETSEIEDLEKAAWYIRREIERLKNDDSGTKS